MTLVAGTVAIQAVPAIFVSYHCRHGGRACYSRLIAPKTPHPPDAT